MSSTKFRFVSFALISLLSSILTLNSLSSVQAAEVDEPQFSNLQFQNRWVEQDRLVGSTGVSRFYTWGPSVNTTTVLESEPYKESPNGRRLVQYFEKARMELNQPFGGGSVTTGLLVRDLVTGQRQDGDNTFATLPPSQTQVAGDDVSVNPDAPVYASFKNVITFGGVDANSKTSTPNTVVNQFINKTGQVSNFTPPENITIGAFQSETGHNIAKVFEDFKNITGPIIDPLTGKRSEGQAVYTTNPTINVFGYAVTEPYWLKSKVAGVEQTLLVQLFQRRVLTYNPSLNGQKVEMGNLGQHYYKWRYIENKPDAPAQGINAVGCLPATDTKGTIIQACLNNPFPTKGTDATLSARLIVRGQAITGVVMNTRWGFFNKLVNCDSQPSDVNGVATCTVNVDKDSSTVADIQIVFVYNGTNYQSNLEFQPKS